MTVKDLVKCFTSGITIRFSDFNKEMTVEETLADSYLCEYEIELVRPLAYDKILVMVCI